MIATPFWFSGSVMPVLLVRPVVSAAHSKPSVGGQLVLTQLRKFSRPAWAAAVASPESTLSLAGRIWPVRAVVAVVIISIARMLIIITSIRLWPTVLAPEPGQQAGPGRPRAVTSGRFAGAGSVRLS